MFFFLYSFFLYRGSFCGYSNRNFEFWKVSVDFPTHFLKIKKFLWVQQQKLFLGGQNPGKKSCN